MTDLVKENYKLLLTIIFAWMFISLFILPVLRKIKYLIILSSFYKNPYVKNIIYILSYIILFFIILVLIDIQVEYQVINISDDMNATSLVISLLTIYGILYTFIQFALGYSNQKENDKYWGESVIEVLLNRGMAFTFFHSKYFKAILLYSAIYPLINWETIPFLQPYHIYLLSFWKIAIALIFLLYVFLFTRSLFIMRRLFLLEKRITDDIKINIERKKEEKYQEFFNYSMRHHNYLFVDVLYREALSLENNERKEFFKNILSDTLYTYRLKQDKMIHKQKARNELYFMKRMFSYIYQNDKLKEIGLSLQELIIMYRISEKIIYNELKLLAGDDEEKFLKELVSVYSSKSGSRYECFLDNVPLIIWDAIKSNDDLSKLHDAVENRDVEKYIYQKSMQSSDDLLDDILASKKYYILKLLNHSKKLLKAFEAKTSTFIFKQNDEKYIDEIIYHYLLDFEFTEANKRYIKIISEHLDYVYKVAIVFYVLLYTGGDDLVNRKKDVLFLKQIAKNNHTEDITNPELKACVIDKISTSNIGRRIDQNLIETIFNNLKRQSTDEEFIQSSINQPYLSYATMVKIKFIMNENHSSFLDFSKISTYKIEQDKFQDDWKMTFIREMLATPSLLKESFFTNHILGISEEIVKENKMQIVTENDFRLFYLNPWFNVSEKEFNDIKSKNHGIGNGILEFLVLKLDQPDYDYLLTNKKLAEYFKGKIRQIIYQSNKNLEDYVNHLASQTNELSETPSISKLKIEIIIYKLTKLMYN